MRKFDNVNELINTLKPDNPVYCIRPKSIKKSVEFFKSNFPGKILYAVKTNPNEKVIKTIINSGIQNFGHFFAIFVQNLVQVLIYEGKEKDTL